MLSPQDNHLKTAESYLAWWQEAGVDYACDADIMNWLQPPVVEDRPAAPTASTAAAPAKQQMAAPPIVPARPLGIASADWPRDIEALKAAIGEGAALPGCGYGSRCVPPLGHMGATAFVIVDCPEEAEVAAARFGEGNVAALLKNMLLAAKILPDFTYQTALAHSRSAANSIPKDELPALAAFLRHQIALVNPQIVIMFGAAVCEALLAQEEAGVTA